MNQAEPIALGDLRLKPWEFWRLTRHEFDLMVAGARRQQRFWWYLVASLAAWLLSPWRPKDKKPLRAEDLLGWRDGWWKRG